ncbi:hypothetical protein [Variovorax terrae]|uniref:TspB protein n=1 Tax=Variovorax terrae TaxID=2923278 RepID=A0A9X1W097_9BURK|nr:hypothetical protein [Variovorax terrae]MCJ0765332.1 hypothetical protein [Variovorax terrae]
METNHAFTLRSLLCCGLVLAALCGLQVAHAQAVPKPVFPPTYTGNITKYGPTTADAANAARFSFGAASNGAMYATAQDYHATPGGKSIPITATAAVNKASMGKAVARFARGMAGSLVAPVGIALNVAQLLRDLGVTSRWTGDHNEFEQPDPTSGLRCGGNTVYPPGESSVYVYPPGTEGAACDIGHYSGGTFVGYRRMSMVRVEGMTTKPMTEQELADKIAAQSGWPTSATSTIAKTLRDVVTAGVPVELEQPTITGPAQADPVEETETSTKREPMKLPNGQPMLDGNGKPVERAVTTETKTTTQDKFKYDKDTVTREQVKTEKVTETVVEPVLNPDGTPKLKPNGDPETKTGAQTTTQDKTDTKPKDDVDQCAKYPNSVACAELDVPGGDIPRTSKELTYAAEDLGFGGGSCPADIVKTIHGQSITVFSYAKGCEIASGPLRALVLSLSAFAAFLILMPGETRV